ncbi:MAG: PQQ-dependent sugar dehydrogenase [Candidatus Eiseniibacteriota bacterium]
MRSLPTFALLLSLAPLPAPAAPAPTPAVALERVASGLADPLYVTAPPGDPRLFVVEQAGRIRIVKAGRLLSTPFLDLTDRVRSGGEQGLLSVAFHPRYAVNGFLYVNYTDHRGDTRVVRYTVGRDPDRADPSSALLVLTVEQPFANHNGGLVIFGPDGMLYVGMGDGGSGGDPYGHGQNRATLLGKLLRLDVDRGAPYAVPHDNPFVGRAGMRGEIWALGLRNPWRFCFDPTAGLLYIADVGQNRWEEIDVARADQGGLDYGWNVMEGDHCFRSRACDRRGRVAPVVEYGHGDGCSVTGGFVYRGRRMPDLVGHYFYADYCRGWIRSFKYEGGVVRDHREWRGAEPGQVTSFGQDAAGELYVCASDGTVHRLVPRRPAAR